MPFRLHNIRTGAALALAPGSNTLGREDDNSLIIDDGSVSRHHARIIPQERTVTVEDLGSANGTAIGGKLIEGPTELRHGETVYFGNVAFELEFQPATGVTAVPGVSPARAIRIRKPTDLVRLEGKGFEAIRSSQPLPVLTYPPAPVQAQPPLESQSLRKGREALPTAILQPVVPPPAAAPVPRARVAAASPATPPAEAAKEPAPSLHLIAFAAFLLGFVVGLATGYFLVF